MEIGKFGRHLGNQANVRRRLGAESDVSSSGITILAVGLPCALCLDPGGGGCAVPN